MQVKLFLSATKTFSISLIIFSLAAGCTKKEKAPVTPQEKSEAAARVYFADHEMKIQQKGAAFKTMDSVKTAMNEDTLNLYQQRANDYLATAELLISTDFKKSGMYSDSSVYWSQKLVAYIKNFKPELSGWKLEYQYPESDYLYSGYVLLDTGYHVLEVKENK